MKGYCRREAARDPGRHSRKAEADLKRYLAEAIELAEK
jgi:hypothetical protein